MRIAIVSDYYYPQLGGITASSPRHRPPWCSSPAGNAMTASTASRASHLQLINHDWMRM